MERKRSAEESSEIDAKKAKKALFATLSSFASRKGERAEMQDTHIIMPKLNLNFQELNRCSFYAIFDGHAGPRASEYCQNNMVERIEERFGKHKELTTLTKTLKSTFQEIYKSIDEGFLAKAKANKPMWKDGTTATTMVIFNNVIYVANIGDSKVIVCRKKDDGTFSPVVLTVDHNPIVHEERMRVQKAGAVVKDGRINGVIEVSRSIGDAPFKSAGVISTPDMKKLTITPNDQFAIIACDGLWKAFSNLEAITYAQQQLESVKNADIELLTEETREQAEYRHVAENLASEAVRRKCGDNVSVIVVKLGLVD